MVQSVQLNEKGRTKRYDCNTPLKKKCYSFQRNPNNKMFRQHFYYHCTSFNSDISLSKKDQGREENNMYFQIIGQEELIIIY